MAAVAVVATIRPESEQNQADFQQTPSDILEPHIIAAAMRADSLPASGPAQPAKKWKRYHADLPEPIAGYQPAAN